MGSDKLSNMNENIDQYVAKVKTLEETNTELNNTNDSLVAAQAKFEAEISELQEKVKNNEDQLQVVDVQKESETAQKVADLESELVSLKEQKEEATKKIAELEAQSSNAKASEDAKASGDA